MNRKIRIGTRDSKLALWQAHTVQNLLEGCGIATELVPVKSEGDLDLITPLYAMGVQGVFTKTLDAFLLSNRIDIAVHSLKDVPTQFARGLAQAAVLKRGVVQDIFVPHPDKIGTAGFSIIGTGSVRRRAQWLNRYPEARIDNLRGNVQTRLRKLAESDWDGAIFAAAGLERLGIRPEGSIDLDWMLPAPSQGAVTIACRADDSETLASCAALNDPDTERCVQIERDFLKTLMGGCSTPIGAFAVINGDRVRFRGNILRPDGSDKMEIEKDIALSEAADLGLSAAKELLAQGADKIVQSIRNTGA
jgi:hydroxymethylbilane synthase